MSLSKIPASPKDHPDEYERRWAGGARPASAEDAGLVDLARKLAPVRPSPEAQAVSEYDRWGTAPIEAATPHSAIAFVRGKPNGPARLDREATQTSGFAVPCSHDPRYFGPATGRRSGRWTRTAALAPAGAALLLAPPCLSRFSGLKEARPEREATSRSRPSSRSWGLRSCRLQFMLTPRLPPRSRRGPRSRRRPTWRRRRLSGRRPRRRSRRS
jgi:hypothetical protein